MGAVLGTRVKQSLGRHRGLLERRHDGTSAVPRRSPIGAADPASARLDHTYDASRSCSEAPKPPGGASPHRARNTPLTGRVLGSMLDSVHASRLRRAPLPLAVLVLAGCVSVPPEPSPLTTITPTAQPTVTPVAEGPPVFCDPVPADSPMTCDAAVAAAIEVLRSDHASIRSSEFGDGECQGR